MYEIPKSERTLWRWVLIALAPGLLCDVLGVLAILVDSDDFNGIVMWLMLLAAPAGLIYLIMVGMKYVEAGMAKSSVGFVFGYGCLNFFLWGAGCGMLMTTLGPMH